MAAWNTEDHNLLIELVRQGVSWAECGARLGRTPNACQVHYGRYVMERVPNPAARVVAPNLTPAQVQRAKALRATGKDGRLCLRKMSKIMGVRLIQLERIFTPKAVEKARERNRVRTPGRNAERKMPIVVPVRVLEERDRSCRPMSISRELLGDPRPGRSALDKRGAA